MPSKTWSKTPDREIREIKRMMKEQQTAIKNLQAEVKELKAENERRKQNAEAAIKELGDMKQVALPKAPEKQIKKEQWK